jgi:hypothetical protein
VGEKVQNEILEVLNGAQMPAVWDETIIVLIPKTRSPERMKDLRPISLCNVIYKIVAKVIASRLKRVLPECISQSQSAFVLGRLITDNIVIAYETTHYMHTRKGGMDGIAAGKLDMSKAYDRVDWSFLEKMMLTMGFGSECVKLVMSCVRTVSYRVKVNNGLTSVIQPQRGLRQGCPLSPYLFLLCGEGLSALFHQADVDGTLKGIQICMGAPRINHMFFWMMLSSL